MSKTIPHFARTCLHPAVRMISLAFSHPGQLWPWTKDWPRSLSLVPTALLPPIWPATDLPADPLLWRVPAAEHHAANGARLSLLTSVFSPRNLLSRIAGITPKEIHLIRFGLRVSRFSELPL